MSKPTPWENKPDGDLYDSPSKNGPYIVAQIHRHEYMLINMRNGNRYTDLTFTEKTLKHYLEQKKFTLIEKRRDPL